MKSHVCYQSGDDGVQEDRADLIKESSRRHKVSSFHDDRRQNDGEEQMSVKLDDLILVAAEVRYHAENDSNHNQKTAFRTEIFQTFTRVKTCTIHVSKLTVSSSSSTNIQKQA